MDKASAIKKEKAIFAMGCFWQPDVLFSNLAGVVSATVGYTGGHTKNPSYEQVCSHATGHAEAVEIVFDAEQISYDELLGVFWENHDPTQLNRQGPDVGDQYRSAIFYHSADQREKARASKEALGRSGKYAKPIATEIMPAGIFYPAEEYHQKYLQKRGLATCHS